MWSKSYRLQSIIQSSLVSCTHGHISLHPYPPMPLHPNFCDLKTHDILGHSRIMLVDCFWWPLLEQVVKQYIDKCHQCQLTKPPKSESHPQSPSLHPCSAKPTSISCCLPILYLSPISGLHDHPSYSIRVSQSLSVRFSSTTVAVNTSHPSQSVMHSVPPSPPLSLVVLSFFYFY